jgi:LytS/YehU family sensor histidine kinase
MIITPKLGGMHPLAYLPFSKMVTNCLKLFLYTFFASLGSYFNWAGIKKIQDDIEMDRKIISMEFLFLKNQFHSHLTFNFLNFCYNKIRKFAPQTADCIEDFSDVLRYSLKHNLKDLVSLEKEINHINQRLSFQNRIQGNSNIKIHYVPDSIQNGFVLPGILSLVIDCFMKNETSSQHEITIRIDVSKEFDHIILSFQKLNAPFMSFLDSHTIKKILETLNFLYDNRYSLKVITDSLQYQVNFILQNKDDKILND